jgi:retinol dehydrogenase 12
MRKDLADGAKLQADGGSEIARKFWDWTEDQVKEYL